MNCVVFAAREKQCAESDLVEFGILAELDHDGAHLLLDCVEVGIPLITLVRVHNESLEI